MLVFKRTFDGRMIPSYKNRNATRLRDAIGDSEAAGILQTLGFPESCAEHVNCSMWMHHFCCIFGSRSCEDCSRLSNSIFDYSSFAIMNVPFVHLCETNKILILCLLYMDYDWRIVSYDRVDQMQCKYLSELAKHEAHFFLLEDELYYAFSQNSRHGAIRIDEKLLKAFPSAQKLIGAKFTKGVVVFS